MEQNKHVKATPDRKIGTATVFSLFDLGSLKNIKRNESKGCPDRYKLFIVRLEWRFQMSLEALKRGKP